MPVAVLVHCVANKVDRSADFCPQMGNEQPQRAGKSDSQAKFAILVFFGQVGCSEQLYA